MMRHLLIVFIMIAVGCSPRSNLCDSIITVSDKEINEIIYAVITTDTFANYHDAFKKENESGILITTLMKLTVVVNEKEWKKFEKAPGFFPLYYIDKCILYGDCLGKKIPLTRQDSLYFVCHNQVLKDKSLDSIKFNSYNLASFDSLDKIHFKCNCPRFSIPVLFANKSKAYVRAGNGYTHWGIYLEKKKNVWRVVKHVLESIACYSD